MNWTYGDAREMHKARLSGAPIHYDSDLGRAFLERPAPSGLRHWIVDGMHVVRNPSSIK
jgi:hypothetical protein